MYSCVKTFKAFPCKLCEKYVKEKKGTHKPHAKKHKLIFFIQVKDNRLKGAVYIQIIRCRKYLCAITEAPDAFMIFLDFEQY